MAKKWAVMIGIILIIVGVCVIETNYIQNSFNFLLNEMNTVETKIRADGENINLPENIIFLENIHTEWRKKSEVLKMIVWHTGIKEVEVNLSRIKTYVEENNSEEALVEVHQLQDFSKHYKDDFKITLSNIF